MAPIHGSPNWGNIATENIKQLKYQNISNMQQRHSWLHRYTFDQIPLMESTCLGTFGYLAGFSYSVSDALCIWCIVGMCGILILENLNIVQDLVVNDHALSIIYNMFTTFWCNYNTTSTPAFLYLVHICPKIQLSVWAAYHAFAVDNVKMLEIKLCDAIYR